jgi:hypothetical protein
VPDAKVPRWYLNSLNSFPYGFFGPHVSEVGLARASLRKARDVLGRNPLSLGPSFQGHPLQLVQTVTEGTWAGGRLPGSARAVILDYGIVRLEEFGRERPFSEHGPAAGRMVVTGLSPVAALNRDGLLVHADLTQLANWHMSSRFAAQDAAKARAEALAVARGLGPVPPAADQALRDAGSPTVTFVDPVGDAGPARDISRLQISPSAGDGLTFSVTIASHHRCLEFGSPDGPLIAIDRDQNPDTGSGYYGTEVALTTDPEGIPQLLRADGWDLRRATRPAGVGGSCDSTGVEFDVPRSAVGLGPRAGFNVVVASLGPRTETAPDIGTFNYQQVRGKAPPKPGPDTRAPHLLFFPELAQGRVVRLGYWVLDGRGRTRETFRIYRKGRLLTTIRQPLHDSNPFALSNVDWHVPRNVRGSLRFTLRSVDAAGNRSKLRSATLAIP